MTGDLRLHDVSYMWRHRNMRDGNPLVTGEFPLYWASNFEFYYCFEISMDYVPNVHVQSTLRWRINGRDSVSNHQSHDCLLNRLFRRRSKKTSKLRVTGLCVGNSPGTGEFPAQMASNAEYVSIWWRHHGMAGDLTHLAFMWPHIICYTGESLISCRWRQTEL